MLDGDSHTLSGCESGVLDPSTCESDPRKQSRLGAQVLWFVPVVLDRV
ncbi:hypothetical protein AWB80_08395 [Caballeronia pedi]|uniref:Uncharacterized protein n=1 Tax=Caballeronia pedi TaxID=1777141 RepID=A0A158E717_9BURK|nr:hypothetical protein AWB80_08395 [Caballeronia pedi]